METDWALLNTVNTTRIKPGYLVSGFLALLVGAFIDCIRGPLLPILSESLSLSYDRVNWILIAGNFTAIPCLLYLPATIERFGDRKTLFSLCGTALLSLAFAWWVDSFGSLLIMGAVLGAVLAFAGTLSNLLVIEGAPEKIRHRLLCGLHAMYGLGAFTASSVVSWGVSRHYSWQEMLGSAAIGVLALFASAYFGVGGINEAPPQPESNKINRWQLFILTGFCFYVAGEVATSMWMVTYLVESKNLSVASASSYLGGFFSMMVITRLICLISLPKKWTPILCLLSLVGFLIFFILGYQGYLWALPLAGVLGPFFPLYLGHLNEGFPTQWRRMTVWLIVGVQLSLATCHIALGRLAEVIGIERAYALPIVLISLAFVTTSVFFKKIQRMNELR